MTIETGTRRVLVRRLDTVVNFHIIFRLFGWNQGPRRISRHVLYGRNLSIFIFRWLDNAYNALRTMRNDGVGACCRSNQPPHALIITI